LKYNEKRPRSKGVTRKKKDKVTTERNTKNKRPETGRTELQGRSNNKRRGYGSVKDKKDILSL